MIETPLLTATQIADGRARLYLLLAQVAAGPIHADLRPYLSALLPLENVQNASPQEFGSRYEAVLGYQILPYAGVFLNADGMIGGPLTTRIAAFYRTAGYAEPLHSGASDHLANLLGCLAHLCAAESDAWHDDQPRIAAQIQALQRELLQHFLLPWLPPLAQALAQSQDEFYAAYGALLVEALADHGSEYQDIAHSVPPLPEPDIPDLHTGGIREIATFLCRPNGAGFYLSPRDLRHMGQQFGVAAGFGGRVRQLETLLQTLPIAELPPLLAQLSTQITHWQAGYASLAQAQPPLQPWITAWAMRVQHTQDLLQRMQQQARDVNHSVR